MRNQIFLYYRVDIKTSELSPIRFNKKVTRAFHTNSLSRSPPKLGLFEENYDVD